MAPEKVWCRCNTANRFRALLVDTPIVEIYGFIDRSTFVPTTKPAVWARPGGPGGRARDLAGGRGPVQRVTTALLLRRRRSSSTVPSRSGGSADIKACAMELGRLQERRVAGVSAGAPNSSVSAPSERFGNAVDGGRAYRRGDHRGRRTGVALRRRWRRAATRLRIATGVTNCAPARRPPSEARTPWLGLLLWGIACAGLFASLIMARVEPDHEPRLAAGIAPAARPSTTPAPFDWNNGVDLTRLPATK